MILTNCAACAAPLAHDAPRCVRCKVRYCNALAEQAKILYRTLTFKKKFAQTVYEDDSATLGDLREAVATLVETARTARRVLGGAHPVVEDTDRSLREALAALRARETSPGRK
jgi:hypothetical protein